ncbi:hypothetical protein QQX98_010463 [Neonectria punicea]|uniref:Retrotransposon gag domain-containing protein n=1 Tax=Neonectria punicea TaxID=979145 RepID=A0ABR1GPR3_9HYPO
MEGVPNSRTPSSSRSTPSRAASRGIDFSRYFDDLEVGAYQGAEADRFDDPHDVDYDEHVSDVDDVDVDEAGYTEDIEDMDDAEDAVDTTEESENGEDAMSTDASSEYMSDVEDTDHIDIDSAHPRTSQSPGSKLNNFNHNSELLQRLNSLVDLGCLSIYTNGWIELDDDMLPVVKFPQPTLSELYQIQRHLEKAPGLSSVWVKFREDLRTEIGLIEGAYQGTSADVEYLSYLSEVLNRGDESLGDYYRTLKELPITVCRLYGIPAEGLPGESDWQTDLGQKLFEQDKFCYTQVDMILREYRLWRKQPTEKLDQARLNIKQLVDGLLEHPNIKLQEYLLETTLFRTFRENAGVGEL